MKKYFAITLSFVTLSAFLGGCNHEVTMQQVDRMVRPQQDRRYVNVNALNLRACPTTQCRILRVLRQGDGGLVLQVKSGWAEMLIDNSDSQGWVATKYLVTEPVAKGNGKPLKPRQQKTEPAPPLETFAQPANPVSPAAPKLQEELAESASGKSSMVPQISEELAD